MKQCTVTAWCQVSHWTHTEWEARKMKTSLMLFVRVMDGLSSRELEVSSNSQGRVTVSIKNQSQPLVSAVTLLGVKPSNFKDRWFGTGSRPKSLNPDKTGTAPVLCTSQPSRPTDSYPLFGLYARTPSLSHTEQSLSAWQQAPFARLLSDGGA